MLFVRDDRGKLQPPRRRSQAGKPVSPKGIHSMPGHSEVEPVAVPQAEPASL
ncbi:hypothetical protein [Paenibacillus lautus]|uniref:hypothetical protein n=1 Tax=Paenibacillus lautus TaxID=1401 RepID=UPI0013E3898F|nr:hypothetical protein [Paenibacillus lautus]